ncbi:hypothetical protein GCM10027169_13360 [Gordonia jinhuaensis]|uniref:Uncharacterized protein n=1 Tax=Gordonia jinhuaensis TaxID=1517702 RepID=A0A916WQD8_9ACTN|nr:hypothetical protein [Gordonia jinhuaensis]GGB22731.1 hypothetical protein GCM10011489_08700 [Gordonia jinhuaensis]
MTDTANRSGLAHVQEGMNNLDEHTCPNCGYPDPTLAILWTTADPEWWQRDEHDE